MVQLFPYKQPFACCCDYISKSVCISGITEIWACSDVSHEYFSTPIKKTELTKKICNVFFSVRFKICILSDGVCNCYHFCSSQWKDCDILCCMFVRQLCFMLSNKYIYNTTEFPCWASGVHTNTLIPELAVLKMTEWISWWHPDCWAVLRSDFLLNCLQCHT